MDKATASNYAIKSLAGTGPPVNVDKATASSEAIKSLAGTGSHVNVDGSTAMPAACSGQSGGVQGKRSPGTMFHVLAQTG